MRLAVSLAIGLLFGAGVDLMVRRDVVKVAAGTLLVSNAAILFVVATGLGAVRAPILPLPALGAVADPLPQALALTAIVINFGTTLLLFRLVRAVEQTHGTLDIADLEEAELSDDPPEPDDAGVAGEDRG